MNTTQAIEEAIANADAHLNNVNLPTYTHVIGMLGRMLSVFGRLNETDFKTSAVFYKGAEQVAIINLIAAAPDLLAALQGIVSTCEVRIDDKRIVHFDAARAAIAKATGG